jgi:hypothetical protein
MKKTEKLRVAASSALACDRLVIHPNDGFDLGMMTKEHEVSVCTEIGIDQFLGGSSGTVSPAHVELRNECPQRTIQVAPKTWERYGMPESAVVLFDGSRLYLHPFLKG